MTNDLREKFTIAANALRSARLALLAEIGKSADGERIVRLYFDTFGDDAGQDMKRYSGMIMNFVHYLSYLDVPETVESIEEQPADISRNDPERDQVV